MFTPKLNVSRGRYSGFNTPNKSGTPSGINRRTSSLYTPARRSPYTPGRNQSLNTSSLQVSQVNDDSTQHKIDRFGGSLPINITETLTLRKRNEEASIRLEPSGWAWLVCGQTLIVWKYSNNMGKMPMCYELSLPPSELPHTSDLVHVFDIGDMASCAIASPSGVVRYWSNIQNVGSYVETSTDIKGEIFCRLVALERSHSCILATTTSHLVHISLAKGQNIARCRTLRPPQGMFSGIGRRMSSLLFGGATSQALGAPLHQIIVGEGLEDGSQAIYVLSGTSLQKWAVTFDTERLLYQCNVESMFRDCLAETIWNNAAAQLRSLKVWLVDMKLVRDGIVIFGAGVNPDVSQQLHYALGTLHTEGAEPPQCFLAFSVPKYVIPYTEEDEKEHVGLRLVLPDPSQASVYLYNSKTVLCMSVCSSSQTVDKIEFHASGDTILGAGHCDGHALMFSMNQGILSIREISSAASQSMNDSIMVDTLSKLDTSVAATTTAGQIEELSMSEDKSSRLKAAFLHSVRGNLPHAKEIVDDLFPPGLPQTDEPGSTLDRLVVRLSQEMIDDYPASDPRWAESVPKDFASSSASLILVHQLEDKLKAHECLVQFLKNVALWDRLSTMYSRQHKMQTRLLLCEHAEKVVAAKALRGLHSKNPQLVDDVIRIVLEQRAGAAPHLSTGLTVQDVFYREVSKMHEFLEALLEHEERQLAAELSPRLLVDLVSSVTAVITGMLFEACSYRQAKNTVFCSMVSHRGCEFLPWTAADGPKGIRDLLIKQHKVTSEKALAEAGDTQERGGLFQQLMELTDLVLDGYTVQLESIKQTEGESACYRDLLKHYEQDRPALINVFMLHQQYERAASLAEKYCDFSVLVRLCEETENQERLNRYMAQFQSRGFSDFVFRWYVEEGKRSKLMTSHLAAHPQLSRFLSAGENKYMSWMHDISANNYTQAHNTLLDLGLSEQKLLAKRKTLLSLAKLAALASDDVPDLELINTEQDLIEQQEQLPQEVLENLGIDPEKMRVFAPRELIEHYVGEYNTNANEFDFKKALDLLHFVSKADPQADYQELILLIWSRAILRDSWPSLPTTDPLETVKETVFFKTVELAISEGMDIVEYLPSVEHMFNAKELQSIQDNRNFQYLLRAGYEHISRMLA